METRNQSIAVILSAGGAVLDRAALADVPGATIVSAEFASGERAQCVAATVEHEGDARALLRSLKPWAAGRGWSVTVAPLPRGD